MNYKETGLTGRRSSKLLFSSLPWLFIAALLPVLQLGFSYYASVQVLAFVFICSRIKIRLSAGDLALLLLGCSLFWLRFVQYSGTETLHAVSAAIREMICFIVLYIGLRGITPNVQVVNILSTVARWLLVISAAFVVAQGIWIGTGRYLGFPISWFVLNGATLEGVDKALEFGTRVRPTGFYGEPSYMGVVVVLMLFLRLNVRPLSRMRQIEAVVLAGISVIALKSIIAALLYIVAVLIWSVNDIKRLFLILGISIAAAVVLSSSQSEIVDRVKTIAVNPGGGDDESYFIRLIRPYSVLKEEWGEGRLIGVLSEELNDRYGEFTVDNGVFYLLITFGLGGIIIILLLCTRLRDLDSILLFLTILNANGGLLTYDKCVLLLFGLAPVWYVRHGRRVSPSTYRGTLVGSKQLQ